MIDVRPLTGDDREWQGTTLAHSWGGTLVARRGELIDAMDLEGFVVLVHGVPGGLLTFAVRGDAFEVVTIDADVPGGGVGRALMDSAQAKARQVGARRMWLITTNDNTRAIRFYQRWGMDLAALHHDGVATSRALKPSIPLTGYDGIPIRHELEFELLLDR